MDSPAAPPSCRPKTWPPSISTSSTLTGSWPLSACTATASRQFQKTVQLLWDLQADRKQTERRDLTRAAGILELHKHKGIPYDPAIDGFVFSKDEIEAYGQRLGASKRHPPASS